MYLLGSWEDLRSMSTAYFWFSGLGSNDQKNLNSTIGWFFIYLFIFFKGNNQIIQKKNYQRYFIKNKKVTRLLTKYIFTNHKLT